MTITARCRYCTLCHSGILVPYFKKKRYINHDNNNKEPIFGNVLKGTNLDAKMRKTQTRLSGQLLEMLWL